MSVELTCPHCTRRLAIRNPQPGVTVHCPVCTGALIVPRSDAANTTAESAAWWKDHPDKKEPPTVEEIPQPWHEMIDRRILVGAVLGTLALVAGMVSVAASLSRPAMPLPVAMFAGEPVEAALPLIAVQSRPLAEPMVADGTSSQPLSAVAQALPLPDDFVAPRWPAAADLAPQPGAEPQKPAPDQKRLTIVRRDRSSDEELRRKLLAIPEVSLDIPGRVNRSSHITSAANTAPAKTHFTPQLLAHWTDLQGLPYQMGDNCQMGKEPAENMQAMSRKLRGIMAESMNKDGNNRLNADYMAEKMTDKEFERTGAIPCYMQMLQPENRPVRQLMVEKLAKIKHRSASEALAKIAVFDLSDEVREEALNELSKRPREEYRQLLLSALRYPWAPAADHAAEAMVALQDKGAVRELVHIASEPDPSAAKLDGTSNTWSVQEVVRVNHLGNCMMCHAPSKNTSDMVRGRVPSPNQPLPPMTQYYEDNRGIFVRADVTYIKQDFSVYQPVDRQGPWPLMQRYDYMVRTRKIETAAELAGVQKKTEGNYPQRQAVLFALGELSR
jgi:hypothetical protein